MKATVTAIGHGVDITRGYQAVELIKRLPRRR
jgi:hypothetical protein